MRLLIFILIVLINVDTFSQADLTLSLYIYDNSPPPCNSVTLEFGLDSTATDSIDSHLGEWEYPLDACWAWGYCLCAGFYIPPHLQSPFCNKDFRYGIPPYTGQIIHLIGLFAATSNSATELNIEWNFPTGVTGTLQDLFTGTLINVYMSDSGSYKIPDSLFGITNQLKMTIDYDMAVKVEDTKDLISYSLEQNYPNPFNPNTMIEFSLPEAANVKLTIYNSLGEKVDEIVNTTLEAGIYSYKWDAANAATGMYIYELRTNSSTGGFVSVKKMLMIK